MTEHARNLPGILEPEGVWRNVFDYHPLDVEIVRAEGVYLFDPDGNKYLDATGGPMAVNVGHGDKRIADAINAQMQNYAYCHPYMASRIRADFCNAIAEHTPGDLGPTYLVSGGSEAVETAIKIARQFHCLTGNEGKHKIVGLYGSYHGMTLGTMALSGSPAYNKYFDPMMPRWPHIPQYTDVGRPADVDRDEWGRRCAEELAHILHYEGAGTVAAFIATPVGVGSDYGLFAPDSYWQTIRQICDDNNVLLIADEVVTGFGRTGKWFAMEHFGVVPDLMVMGKGIASSNMPLGGVTVSERINTPFKDGARFLHGFTNQGHPLACAAGLAVLDVLERDKLLDNARIRGAQVSNNRDRLVAHPTVANLTGRGLLMVMELVESKETGAYFDGERDAEHLFQSVALTHGLVFYSSLYGSRRGAVARGLPMWISPPLTITEFELDDLLDRLDATLTEWESLLGVNQA